MQKALIITSDKFPQGDAGALRQECFSLMLKQLGYDVTVFGMGAETGFQFRQYAPGIKFLSLRGNRTDIMHRLFDRIAFSNRCISLLNNSEVFDVIVVISVPYKLLNFLKKYRKKYNSILIHDSVEWYSPCEFLTGRMSFQYIVKDLMNRKWIDENFRVIAISSYLEQHFANRGLLTKRIPVIMQIKDDFHEKSLPTNDLSIIYAGQIARKDLMSNFFEAVAMLEEEEKKRIIIHVFGPTKQELFSTHNLTDSIYSSICENLIIHGRVQREEIITAYRDADFSVIFRKSEERYAKAGFPTKVVESLKLGTPVLCNLSSDLGNYLEDSYNSIICETPNTGDIFRALKRITGLSVDDKLKMRNAARETAVRYFDYTYYLPALKGLLEDAL